MSSSCRANPQLHGRPSGRRLVLGSTGHTGISLSASCMNWTLFNIGQDVALTLIGGWLGPLARSFRILSASRLLNALRSRFLMQIYQKSRPTPILLRIRRHRQKQKQWKTKTRSAARRRGVSIADLIKHSPNNFQSQEALVRTNLHPTLQIDYDVVLSPTYQVPVLYFVLRWHNHQGPVGLDAVYQYVVPEQYKQQLQNVGVMGGISFGVGAHSFLSLSSWDRKRARLG